MHCVAAIKIKSFYGQIRLILISILFLLLAGCASTQKIKINSIPPRAKVFVNEVPVGITNTDIKLNEKKKKILFESKKRVMKPKKSF